MSSTASRSLGLFTIVIMATAFASVTARADPVEDFYRGKTINFYIGSTPGGGYDLYARLVGQFLGDHIPGKPRILPRNMPGGEGRLSAAYVFGVVAPDGLSLGTSEQSLPLAQAIGDKSVTFDTGKLNWIGNPSNDNKTLVTWHTSGVKTMEDAKRIEVSMGANAGGGSSIYPKAANALLGTRFKIIRGYPGGTQINLAMEKGEVGGRAGNAWQSWKTINPGWLTEHKINILVQIGLHKASDLPDVPLLVDLAPNADAGALLKLLSAPIALGHPIYTSPNVPAERVKALREAFVATMKDPALLEAAKKRQFDIEPASGAELQHIVADMLGAPADIRARLAAIDSND